MEMLIRSDLIKRVFFQATNFVTNIPLLTYVNEALYLTIWHLLLVYRIAATIIFRLFFGIWLKSLNVVPFEVCEREKYFEDPGVMEMRALLRGEDCFDTYLDQQQKLPFPPADFDPFDKIYLAVPFSRLQRGIQNVHKCWIQHNSAVYRKISNSSLFQYFVRYLSSHVAVNVDE